MIKSMPTLALFVGGLSLTTLAGCERVEQAATEAVEQARQSTAELLEAARTGSLESAGQKANQALQEAKRKAAVMLGEASEYLGGQPPANDADAPADQPATTAL